MQARDQKLDPLNGFMDTRSPAGTRDPSVFRLIFNMDGSEAGSYCRLGGWRRYAYQEECYLNQDLHDQMLCGQTYSLSDAYTVQGYSLFLGVSYGSCQTEIVPGYTATQSIGDYCGYGPSAPFPQQQVIGSPFICNQFIGWPYYTAPSPLTGPTGKNTWQVEAKTNASSWEKGELSVTLSWWSDTYGPGTQTLAVPNQSPETITYTFDFCIPQDAVNVHVDLSFGDILSGPTNTMAECEPAPTEWPCVTAGPEFWRLSSYSLCLAQQVPESSIVRCDSVANLVYQDIPDREVEYCRGMYLLGRQCREAITLLYSFKSQSGARRLIAGTMSRLYVNNERGGNWRILADNLGGPCVKDEDCGCSPKRFTVAQMGDFIIFTNGIDPVLVWSYDEGPEGCFNWSADYLPDLLALNITAARVCGSYQGFLFLGDVTADSERLTSRLHWSDFNNPLGWAPGGESLAGFQDFGRGETILSIQPIGGKIRVYTDKAVYDGIIVSDARLFSFQEVYRGDRVPIFRHSVVNTGENHYFIGENAVFRMAEYDREPTPFDWVNLSCGAIYNGVPQSLLEGVDNLFGYSPINKANCFNAVGGHDSINEAVWFSWPTGNSQCPNQSIVLWPDRRKASLVDHGFTAFCVHQPDDSLQVRDFLAAYGLCDPSLSRREKESVFCDITFEQGSFTSLWNPEENPDAPKDPGSFLASLEGVCSEDLCLNCDTPSRFLMACAEGKSIVEFTPESYVREVYIEQQSDPCVLPPAPPLPPPPPPPPPPPIIEEPQPEPDPDPDPEFEYPEFNPAGVSDEPQPDAPCGDIQAVIVSNYVYSIDSNIDPNSVIPQSWITCHQTLLDAEVQMTWQGAVRNGPYKWVFFPSPAIKRSANLKVGNGDCDPTSGLNDSPFSFSSFVTLAAPYCLP